MNSSIKVNRIRKINRLPVKSDEDSTPEWIPDTEDWHICNKYLGNPNESEDDGAADVQSDIEHDNSIKDCKCPEQRDVIPAPNSISNTDHWLLWNGDFDNPNDSKDDWVADDESDIEQDDSIEDPEYPEQRDVSPAPNFTRLILPTQK